ncbi:hypothetical protein MUP56_01380 [Patescibacteria group bacterium]|nr:hypothetical protein [Patescibacteria group bacterium]
MENQIQPNTPPVQSIPQTPAPVSPSINWSKILFFILLGVFVVIGSVFFGIQIGKNKISNSQSLTEQPMTIFTSPSTQLSPSTNPTSFPMETEIPAKKYTDLSQFMTPTVTVIKNGTEINTKYVSPDELITQIKILCGNKNYRNVAFSSVKKENGKYQLISSSDLSETNNDPSYVMAAEDLCGVVTSDATIEKKKISDTEWDYRYIFSWGGKQGYDIVFVNEGWKFVLYKSMLL